MMERSNSAFPYEEEMKRYNQEVDHIALEGFRNLNHFVMDHTQKLCHEVSELSKAIAKAIKEEFIVKDNGDEDKNKFADGASANIILSSKRTYEAAKAYKGKKVAVLNFANNHHVGGAPWSAGAQEECLCRASTLYPCIAAKQQEFYDAHSNAYHQGQMDDYGNDDLIYTPGVIVFKTDESAPKLMSKEDWYAVDVITCAAPQLGYFDERQRSRFVEVMTMRIQKILQVAKKQGVEVLILGAFGCGAFNNPPVIVAKIFKEQLRIYHFETVEFAIYDRNPGPRSNYAIFTDVFRR